MEPLRRRDFLRRSLAAGALGALGGAASGDPPLAAARPPGAAPAEGAGGKSPRRRAGRPRIGCVSWCFHSFAPGADPSGAIEMMGRLGFEGTDLILLAAEDVKGFWTDERTGRIRGLLEKHGLAVAQFVLFQRAVGGLSSLDRDERERSLDVFEAGCAIGRKLGAPVIDIVAPWPRELHGPRGYLPRYYEIRDPSPGEKFHIDIASGFDWDAVWSRFADTVKACLERTRAHGMKLTIEHHTHCIVPDASSFLRLHETVGDPDLGYNLDTGWTLLQREYPPLAIHKVRDHLMNLHVRDIDGRMSRFVPIGTGVMDFDAIGKTLVAVGYDGFLSVEQDKYRDADMADVCWRYIEIMKRVLGR